MRNPSTILTFGMYVGLSLSNPVIPLSYVRWIAKCGSYQEPGNKYGDAKWKVPIDLMVLARREWERRTGERWEG